MKKSISQAELKKIQARGGKVKRTMGAAPKPEPKPTKAESPTKSETPSSEPTPMASMRGSMEFFENQFEANRQVIAHNAEMIRNFGEDLKKIVDKDPIPYTFELKRSAESKLLEKVFARPGIHE